MEVSSSDRSCESELWLLRLRPLSSLVLVTIVPVWFSALTLWILIGWSELIEYIFSMRSGLSGTLLFGCAMIIPEGVFWSTEKRPSFIFWFAPLSMLRFRSLGEFLSAAAIPRAYCSLGELASRKLLFSKSLLAVLFFELFIYSSIVALISLIKPSFSVCYDLSLNGPGLTLVLGLVIIGNFSCYLSLHNPSIRVWTLKCEAYALKKLCLYCYFYVTLLSSSWSKISPMTNFDAWDSFSDDSYLLRSLRENWGISMGDEIGVESGIRPCSLRRLVYCSSRNSLSSSVHILK